MFSPIRKDGTGRVRWSVRKFYGMPIRNWESLFYVLPSSTHELILVKESIDMKPEELKQMVHDVNLSEVASEDLLSFQVFHYDGKKLSIAKEDVQKLSDTVEKAKNHSLLH